jgi:hypothetical protein
MQKDKMKKLFSILSFIWGFSVLGQNTVCQPGRKEFLTINKTKEITNIVNGTFVGMKEGQYSGYNLVSANDINEKIALVFTGAIWMGGKTKSGELRFSGTTNVSLTDGFDWYPGPLDQSGNTNEIICKNFDEIFKVTYDELKLAIDLIYKSDGTIDPNACSVIPENVKYWPGRGNPYFKENLGFDLPDVELATFFDKDKDGIYNPCNGDLPILETKKCEPTNAKEVLEAFPSALSYWVVNDNGGPHKLSSGDPMKMEIHNYMFSFDDKAYEDMTFYKFKSVYKGEDELNDVFFSTWVDADLGCYTDDYIGTVAAENMMFCYNGDANDGDNGSCQGGVKTFKNEMPMLGVSYLQGFEGMKANAEGILEPYDTGLTSSTYSNRCGGEIPVEPVTCDPQDRDEPFYDKIRGLWVFGDAMTFGGTGSTIGSEDTVKYILDGNPANPQDWSMCSALFTPNDVRFNLNTGGISMKKNQSNEAIIAVTLARDVTYPCPDNRSIVEQNKKAKMLFKNCWKLNPNSISNQTQNIANWNFSHSPNGFSIKNIDDAINVTITDVEGKLISTHAIQKGIDMNWEASKHGITNKMIFVKVQSKVTGSTRGYKIVVLNQ